MSPVFLIIAASGVAAMVIGILAMLLFAFEFDTTVREYDGTRTHNTGLLNDRLVGVIISAAITLLGAVGLATVARAVAKQTTQVGDQQLVYPSDPPKDPVFMCVLSVLVVGLGQILVGQTAKGFTLLGGTLAFGIITCGGLLLVAPIIWVAVAVDAYRIATKLKQGTPVRKWEFF